MMYNKSEIEARVARNKRDFVFRASIFLFVMLVALVLIILDLNKILTFSMIVAELLMLLLLSLTIERYAPSTLFSGEITGTNIKEDEYTIIRKSGPGMRYKQLGAPSFGGPPIAPSTGANKRRTPPALRAAVYLKLDDGSIIMLRGLYKAHADIYEDGDTLLKYAGTKFPVILSRSTDTQPCPICGEVNRSDDKCCAQCGLEIV